MTASDPTTNTSSPPETAEQRPASAYPFNTRPYEHAPPRTCRTCSHFKGQRGRFDLLKCEHPKHPTLIDGYRAERGCVYWDREPGADDE